MISASDAIEITDFSSPIDLVRQHTKGSEILGLQIVTAETGGGTLVVTTKGSDGAERTLTVSAGDLVELSVRTIESATDVSRVRVLF